ncbi:MAG: hypothetical protein O4808_17850, partial [Trichodesmium sp. St17_bin3_1_1]|nr:hypothetical protein [Trichodesmium sp. St17_bin3_1_1]
TLKSPQIIVVFSSFMRFCILEIVSLQLELLYTTMMSTSGELRQETCKSDVFTFIDTSKMSD